MLLPFYYILVVLIYILALPFLLFLSIKQKYKFSIPSRFFLYKNSSFKKNGIWFHACSLGEINSLEPILNKVNGEINISATTQTGVNAAKKYKNANVRYLPFEIFLPFWISKQKRVVVTEAELWPMIFVVCKLKGIKTTLINARISDNSYASYKKFAWFYKWLFSYVDDVFAQSKIDKERLIELGAKNVVVSGNIKTLSKPNIKKEYAKPKKNLLLYASTHEGEEELLLKNIIFNKNNIYVFAPRHPERFEKVDKLLRNFSKMNDFSYSRFSENESFTCNIILCDKMGTLVNLYAISDIVYLCGSFKDGIGGHNPLEPAYFKNKIISGPFYFNQKPLFELVENIKVCSINELKNINLNDVKKSKILKIGDIDILVEKIKQ